MRQLVFYLLAAITLGSAVCVVFLRRPLHNVLFMILTMIGLAGLFITLHAEFVAMVQLVVYAGAVMVLFLFVIMLLNLDEASFFQDPGSTTWVGMGCAVILALVLVPVLMTIVPRNLPGIAAGGKGEVMGNTALIARELFTTYLLPFEIVSVLLLAAIIGAVILVKKRS